MCSICKRSTRSFVRKTLGWDTASASWSKQNQLPRGAAPVASSSKKEEIHPPISAAISGTIPPNHSHSREDVTPPLGSFAQLLRIPKTPPLHTLPTRMVPKPPNFPPPESAKRGYESADGGASTHPKALAKKRPRTKNTSPSSYWI